MDQELLKKYLEGDASSDEKHQILTWVKADEKNRSEFLALRRLYDIALWHHESGRKQKTQKAAQKHDIN